MIKVACMIISSTSSIACVSESLTILWSNCFPISSSDAARAILFWNVVSSSVFLFRSRSSRTCMLGGSMNSSTAFAAYSFLIESAPFTSTSKTMQRAAAKRAIDLAFQRAVIIAVNLFVLNESVLPDQSAQILPV